MRDRGADAAPVHAGAARRGTLALKRDPGAGVDPLLAANRDLERDAAAAAVKATLPAFFPGGRQAAVRLAGPDEWDAYGAVDAGERAASPTRRSPAAFTNEFLPGEGV